MRILAIGDVTSRAGVAHLEAKLWQVIKDERIDFTVVNCENAGFVTGASPELAERLLQAGADCLTGGNHTLRNRSVLGYLDSSDRMLRPINYGSAAEGSGYTILSASGYRIMVISAMGNVHIEPTLDAPFGYIERALARESGNYDFAILDIHAEATGEKLAVAHAFDGAINVIFGTHTHVPTADLTVLPRGTGYVTDLGMCGESGGILGMEIESVIARVRDHLTTPFRAAPGAAMADGVIFELAHNTGRVTDIKRIRF